MNVTILIRTVLILALMLGNPLAGRAQGSIVRGIAEALAEQIMKKGGQESIELAALGGSQAVKGVLRKAAQEGGEVLAQKVARYTSIYGVDVLKCAKESPAQFIKAFESITPNVRMATLQAVRREPELMPQLISKFGKDAMIVAAKHPGVGTSLIRTFGEEGIAVAEKVSKDEGIQLARLSGQISKLPSEQRSQFLDIFSKAPQRVIELLERNPKVLKTGAVLAAFLASKDQLLGSDRCMILSDGRVVPVHNVGLMERMTVALAPHVRGPILIITGMIGLCISGWAGIQLWAGYRISRAKVRDAEAKIAAAGNKSGKLT